MAEKQFGEQLAPITKYGKNITAGSQVYAHHLIYSALAHMHLDVETLHSIVLQLINLW